MKSYTLQVCLNYTEHDVFKVLSAQYVVSKCISSYHMNAGVHTSIVDIWHIFTSRCTLLKRPCVINKPNICRHFVHTNENLCTDQNQVNITFTLPYNDFCIWICCFLYQGFVWNIASIISCVPLRTTCNYTECAKSDHRRVMCLVSDHITVCFRLKFLW